MTNPPGPSNPTPPPGPGRDMQSRPMPRHKQDPRAAWVTVQQLAVQVAELAQQLELLAMIQETNTAPLAFSCQQVADRLGCSEKHVRRLVAAGTIQSLKVGSKRRITPEALQQYMRDQEAS